MLRRWRNCSTGEQRGVNVASVPEHYETLGLASNASRQEIERAHQKRVNDLRTSRSADALAELAEVDVAYRVLHDPVQRAHYDVLLRVAEAEEDKQCAKLDSQINLRTHRPRKRVDGVSGLLDTLGWIFKLLK